MRRHALTIPRLRALCLPQSVLTLSSEWEWQRMHKREQWKESLMVTGGAGEVISAIQAALPEVWLSR
jgi:hypothetical protein